MARAALGPRGISTRCLIVGSVIIPAPLVHIPVAVVKPPGIRGKAADSDRLRAVLPGAGLQDGVVEVVLLDLIGIVPVEVGFFRVQGLLQIEGRHGPGTVGIFPLGLCRKPVARGAAIPDHAVLGDGIGRLQAGGLAPGIGIENRVQPGDALHRKIRPCKFAGINSYQALIVCLRRLIGVDIERGEGYFMLRFVLNAPVFRLRTAHEETAGRDQHKTVLYGNALRLLRNRCGRNRGLRALGNRSRPPAGGGKVRTVLARKHNAQRNTDQNRCRDISQDQTGMHSLSFFRLQAQRGQLRAEKGPGRQHERVFQKDQPPCLLIVQKGEGHTEKEIVRHPVSQKQPETETAENSTKNG